MNLGVKKFIQVQYIPIDLLKEWDLNPRKNDSAVERLSKLIQSHGFINPVIATEDNIIRAGHTRVKAAKRAGLKEVPVILIDMDEKQAQAFAIADNKSSEWAEWDFTKLKDLMEDLDTGELDLELTGFDNQEIEKLMIFTPESEKENLDNINPAIELINLTEDLKLFISLISAKLKINLRTPLRFFTLYNMTVKDFDSLKAIKKNCDESTIEFIANETVKVLIQIYGNLSNFTICPAPQGSQTKKNGKHFATNICNKIGEILNIPVLEIFNKNSKTKFGQSNSLIDIVNVPDNIIFFDDVHTTGRTLTSCLNLIRHKFVIPIVFIDNNI